MPELEETTRPIGQCVDSGVRVSAPKRLYVLSVSFLLALLLVIVGGTARSGVAQQGVAQRLPDLRMGWFHDLKIREVPDGRRLLRFSTIMVNVGAGPFEVHGQRLDTDPPGGMTSVNQRINDDAGGYLDEPTPATLFFSGDGHDHWHITKLQSSTLRRLDGQGSGPVRVGAKNGFCVYDYYLWNGTLPRSPERKMDHETNTCGEAEEKAAQSATMGLSVVPTVYRSGCS
jgi:hypothetical protein